MNAARALFGVAFGSVVFCTLAAHAQTGLPPQGQPVTAKDIVGKKICWNDGHWSFYAANGGFSNDRNPARRSQVVAHGAGPHQDRGMLTGRSRSCPTDNFFPTSSAADVGLLQDRAPNGERCVTS